MPIIRTRHLEGRLGGARGPLDVDAELRLLLAGRDVAVRLGVDIGVDAEGDRRDCPIAAATRAIVQFGLALDVEHPDAGLRANRISSSVLPTPAKQHLAGVAAGLQNAVQFAAADRSNPLPSWASSRRMRVFEQVLTR